MLKDIFHDFSNGSWSMERTYESESWQFSGCHSWRARDGQDHNIG